MEFIAVLARSRRRSQIFLNGFSFSVVEGAKCIGNQEFYT